MSTGEVGLLGYTFNKFWQTLAKQKSFNQRKRAIRSKSDLWTFDGFQKKTLMKVGNITKAAAFKSCLHLCY